MQIPSLILALAIEVYFLLLVATLVLIWYSRKQKKLVNRQQTKLLELINELKSASAPPPSPKTYKHYINEQLETTQSYFDTIAPGVDIAGIQPTDVTLDQRVVALRYAFLRAEELGTTEDRGSAGYWNIFQQTLEPLLPPPLQEEPIALEPNNEELETYKKRVENLEKFKKLYFELEGQWQEAQASADEYYQQLTELLAQLEANPELQGLLNGYHNSFYELANQFTRNRQLLGESEHKTINIVRRDPRAADEIMKLRNVAADQYRIINNLQRKLEEAQSDQQKALIVHELEQQLQRQIRFVQESDTCIQLLEDELAQANERIAQQAVQLESDHLLSEENQRIKETLQSFTMESKELVSSVNDLEQENAKLRSNLEQREPAAENSETSAPEKIAQIQADFIHLQKQYADLEEKYLSLKLK